MSATNTQDTISDALAAEARKIVAQLAMLDARDMANRAVAHANGLRELGGEYATAAADTFDRSAAYFRALEIKYTNLAGVAGD